MKKKIWRYSLQSFTYKKKEKKITLLIKSKTKAQSSHPTNQATENGKRIPIQNEHQQ